MPNELPYELYYQRRAESAVEWNAQCERVRNFCRWVYADAPPPIGHNIASHIAYLRSEGADELTARMAALTALIHMGHA